MAASRFFSPCITQPTLPQFQDPEVAQTDPAGALSPSRPTPRIPAPPAPQPYGEAFLESSRAAWQLQRRRGPVAALGRGAPVAPPSPTPHLAQRRVCALLSRIDVGGGGRQALRSRGVTLHIQRGC